MIGRFESRELCGCQRSICGSLDRVRFLFGLVLHLLNLRLLINLKAAHFDATIYAILLLAAIFVLVGRWRRVSTLLLSNWAILIYFLYCLISVGWSDHPDIALKRWIKATTDLAMVLVIVTDIRPAIALDRLISRVGFVLFPTSVLLIKYFPLLGRNYSPDGILMNTGVTPNKNVLGVVLLVVCLCALSQVILLWKSRRVSAQKRHLIAHLILLGFGIWLFRLADSSTSLACFMLGAVFIFASDLPAFKRHSGRLHALCLVLILTAATILFFGGQGTVAGALGRKSNLSGRTDIWAAVIPAVPNNLFGAGFESFCD